MFKKTELDWKTYEAITKYIYETLGKEHGVKIEAYGSNCKVKGKSGVSHQIDVLTNHSDGIHIYKTAIECKYWKDKVNKDIVMKVYQIIEDTGIDKGIIVSKSGFTPDALSFAEYRNIGLVELREIEKKDFSETPKEILIGDLLIKTKILITRPKILKIDLGNDHNIAIKDEWDYNKYSIILENKTELPLLGYVNQFRNEIIHRNKKNLKITKQFEIPNSILFNKHSRISVRIDQITLTGQLTEIDTNKKLNFKFVDQVWLVMKSIFEDKIFTFSKGGLIVKCKK